MAPPFTKDGRYRTFPTVTVIFNGVLVQNNTIIVGTTEYIGFPKVAPHDKGPLRLQAHMATQAIPLASGIFGLGNCETRGYFLKNFQRFYQFL